MILDRSAIFISLADLLLCVVSVVIVAVAPVKAKQDGIRNARQLISADWDVALDSDVDLWVIGPTHKPVFYGSRLVGCSSIDRDSLGHSTSLVTLADGSITRQDSNKETDSVRCIEPGHWDIGVNLYSDRELRAGVKGIKTHVEITNLNPYVSTVWAGDVVLSRVGQTVNVVSFDMAPDGTITIVQPPLEPITDVFKKETP